MGRPKHAVYTLQWLKWSVLIFGATGWVHYSSVALSNLVSASRARACFKQPAIQAPCKLSHAPSSPRPCVRSCGQRDGGDLRRSALQKPGKPRSARVPHLLDPPDNRQSSDHQKHAQITVARRGYVDNPPTRVPHIPTAHPQQQTLPSKSDGRPRHAKDGQSAREAGGLQGGS